MRTMIRTMLLALCAILMLNPSSIATEAATNAGTLQIQNREYGDNTLSFTAALSGTNGRLAVCVYSENGQMKESAFYQAKSTVSVTLENVADTDYVKAAWLDNAFCHLAEPTLLRMNANSSAANQRFITDLRDMQSHYSVGGGGESSNPYDPYALARLIVKHEGTLPDLSAYHVAAQIQGSNNITILQFGASENATASVNAKRCAEYLSGRPGVRYVNPDRYIKSETIGTGSGNLADLADAGDGHLSWGVDLTGIGRYAENLLDRGVQGSVTVAVIDSGADLEHPFLKGRLLPGYDYVENDEVPQDELSHGTHVAGIITDCTAGFDVKIMPIRIITAFNDFTTISAMCAILQAADSDAEIINLSLSAPNEPGYESIAEAVQYAISKNKIVVAAAGNQHDDTKKRTPAHIEECITISAVTEDKGLFGINNFGSSMDLSAPGDRVLSSVPMETGKGYADTNYDYMSGTSMATPHVSAAAALLLLEYGRAMTPAQISDLLRSTAEDRGLPGWDKYYGAGILNMRPFIRPLITFNSNGGAGTMEPQTVAFGTPTALNKSSFTRDGYTFFGWNTNADGTGNSYGDGESITTEENLTLYAQWKPQPNPVPVEPLSWGATATHLKEYAELLNSRAKVSPLPEITVAVVDSGVDSDHPFLAGRLTAGYDYVENDDTPQDENGYGTSIAGIIADCTPNNVKIMPVKVLDVHGSVSKSNFMQGILHAVDKGADVITLGLSAPVDGFSSIDEAVKHAISRNITVITAAGNQNGDASTRTPAHIEECITVTAVNEDMTRFSIANYGDAIDTAAPGTDINSCAPGGQYITLSGTSIASAFATAAAADLLCDMGTDMTPAEISNALRSTATDLGDPGWDKYFGAGMLDMTAFICGEYHRNGVFALLYTDGEMVFQNTQTPADGRTLVQAYPVQTSAQGSEYSGWYNQRSMVQKVTFAERIQPKTTALWFYDCGNLTEINGLENLDTSSVTNMNQMFARCGKLTELDITGFNTAMVTNMGQMFQDCAALKTIYASDKFTTNAVTSDQDMFDGCASIKGGRGTKFDSGHIDKTYAHIDGGVSIPGYFTDKNNILILGDVNGDMVVTKDDADMVGEYRVGLRQLTKDQEYCADVNADGVVDNIDLLMISRYAEGLLDKFPAET